MPEPTTDDDAKVVELDDHRPIWSAWHATCLACAKRWVATVQRDVRFLECPDCHEMRGICTAPVP